MNTKKKAIVTIMILAILISIWVWSVYLVDPFYHYHEPWFGLQPIATNQEYQMIGMAKYFDYDSAIVGSSMTENFKSSWFDEAYGCHTIKLSFQLGRMENYDQILNAIFSTHKVKNIFFGLDFNAIGKAPWQITLHKIPEYLVDDNKFNDVNYLLNKEVMFNYLLPYVRKNIVNQVPNFDEAWNWENKYIFSREKVLREYQAVRLKEIKTNHKSLAESMKYAESNMKVITKYIEENPNTSFYIFYPPFGILVYDDLIKRSEFENCMAIMQFSAQELLKYDNVKLYLFQDMRDIITNLDLYKDTAHYNESVNRLMIQSLKNDEYRITSDNYMEKFNHMEKFLKGYNYDDLFLNL